MMEALGVLGSVVIVALVVWSVTAGRRYFIGERARWPQMRRDLYSGSLDEGQYPLDPPPSRRADAEDEAPR